MYDCIWKKQILTPTTRKYSTDIVINDLYCGSSQEQSPQDLIQGICSEYEIKLNYNKLDEMLVLQKYSDWQLVKFWRYHIFIRSRYGTLIECMEATLFEQRINYEDTKDKRLYEKLEFNLFKIIRRTSRSYFSQMVLL